MHQHHLEIAPPMQELSQDGQQEIRVKTPGAGLLWQGVGVGGGVGEEGLAGCVATPSVASFNPL